MNYKYHAVVPDVATPMNSFECRISEMIRTISEREEYPMFDDGTIGHFLLVRPELNRINRKGIFFIITSNVGLAGYMDWNHIRRLVADGHAIGSHSHTHRRFSTLNQHATHSEIATSKELIENNADTKCEFLSAPHDDWTAFAFRSCKLLNVFPCTDTVNYTAEMFKKNKR